VDTWKIGIVERVVKLAETVSQAGDLPCILDVGAGNGFLAYLLARTERVKVIGIEPNKYLIRKTKFEHENMELIAGEIESFVPNKRIDIVINSFMPYRLDFSPLVKKTIRPAAFVYIQDKKIRDERNYVYIDLKVDERKNKFEYKIDKRVSFNPDDGYKRALGWSVYSVGADRKEINSLDCEIEVQFEKNIGNINKDLVFNVNDKERYRWEKEIDQRKI
jgi:SAM-dependent methyltransferase